MQTFHNGRLPRAYDEDLIDDLADLLRQHSDRAGARGMRVSFEWLAEALDGDTTLAKHVLRAAGFRPPEATFWTTGRGDMRLENYTSPDVLADKLTDVLDEYDPV